MSKRKVIVSVSSDLVTDNRVHRTCSLLHEMGLDVLLVGRKKKTSPDLVKRAYRTRRLRLFFEKGPFFYMELNFRLFFLLLFSKKHLLYANDLDTLLSNFMVSRLSASKLIYDSHELFTEAPELIHRKRTQSIWLAIERFIFPRLQHIVTVNDSIAEAYQNRYQKKLLVIRNIPTKFQLDQLPTKDQLGIPLDRFLLIMQGAGLNVERGIEEVVLAVKELDDVALMLVGDGDVMPLIKNIIQEHHLEQKVFIYGRRPYHEMMEYTSHADLGITMDKPLSKNYEFSLPNKLFDYMHAGVPILASNLVEISRVIHQYQIGTIVEEVDVQLIAQAISELKANPEKLKIQKTACLQAAQIENWEMEKGKLRSFIDNVLID